MYLTSCLSSLLGPIRSSSFIFALAVILGLCYPAPAHILEPLITPALLMIMIFSIVEIDLSTRGELKGTLIGLCLNYILLSSLIIVLSSFLADESLRQGFVVMAAVPPAVAVLPLTKLLRGDSRLSLYAEAIC
jgi:BASS family bile acid:Na+ symporter